jgi:hypothetical protein
MRRTRSLVGSHPAAAYRITAAPSTDAAGEGESRAPVTQLVVAGAHAVAA